MSHSSECRTRRRLEVSKKQTRTRRCHSDKLQTTDTVRKQFGERSTGIQKRTRQKTKIHEANSKSCHAHPRLFDRGHQGGANDQQRFRLVTRNMMRMKPWTQMDRLAKKVVRKINNPASRSERKNKQPQPTSPHRKW